MTKRYPDTYLHIRDSFSGREFITPIRSNTKLDLTALVKRWIKKEWAGELKLAGKIDPHWEGEFYAKIITDGRPPTSVVVWDCGGFSTCANY